MSMGNCLIEAHDHAEQNSCELADALEALHWFETHIRPRPVLAVVTFDSRHDADPTLPF